MKRVSVAPRDDYLSRASKSGVYNIERTLSNGEKNYTWDESSAYLIDREEVDYIIDSISPIISMSYEALDFLLDGEWGTFGVSRPFFEYIRNTFDDQELDLFTRYDFAYMNNGELKLVGIEADSPRGLIETAQVQRTWLWDKFSSRAEEGKITQLNRIQELTNSTFRQLLKESSSNTLHIARGDSRGEDWITSAFLKGIARDAGWHAIDSRMKEIRWDVVNKLWVDGKNNEITNLYKHYPWDMMLRQKIAKDMIINSNQLERVLEPSWKMLFSSRVMLPALYELFPKSDVLSPAYMQYEKHLGDSYVTSTLLPLTSRNEMALLSGRSFTSWGETPKNFDNQRSLTYRKLEVPKRYKDKHGGYRFIYVSAYTVAGQLAGIGMRETKMPLLGAHTTFRPHLVQL